MEDNLLFFGNDRADFGRISMIYSWRLFITRAYVQFKHRRPTRMPVPPFLTCSYRYQDRFDEDLSRVSTIHSLRREYSDAQRDGI